MKIYTITEAGARAAKNIHNPSGGAYRVLNYLSQVGTATTEQIKSGVGISSEELQISLSVLRKNQLIARG